jgi:hypothetical protein
MLNRLRNCRLPFQGPGQILLTLICLAAAAAGAFLLDRFVFTPDPNRPPDVPARNWELAQRWAKAALPVGAPAPDFTLPALRDGQEWHLADFRGRRPVVLVFGSFSCDLFCQRVAHLNLLYRAYQDRAEFRFVAVTEAGHRIRGLDFQSAAGESPRRRRAAVRGAAETLGLAVPGVVDGPDERVMRAYRAFPRRLVVVDRQGRIALDLGTGLAQGEWNLARVGKWLQTHTPAAGGV